jgi:DNA-binding CsgD family transcriptional regulator
LFLFFLFEFFSIHIQAASENNKTSILIETKQLVINECEENNKIHSIIHQLDSLINVPNLSEQTLKKAINSAGEIFRQQGKLSAAIELYLETIAYYKQINNPTVEDLKSMVMFFIPLGASHEELGMWNHAMDFYYEALKLAEENNFEIQKAMIYNNIGAIHYKRDEWGKAEFYWLKAIEINKKNGIKKELFNNYNNIAGICMNRKDYDKALDYALLAIQLLDHEKDQNLYYFMQTNIAGFYLQKKDYKLALSYLINAEEHQVKYEFTSDLVQTYAFLSIAYEMTGMLNLALNYMEKALNQAILLQNKHVESQVRQDFAAYYERNGQISMAYQMTKEAYQIRDSIAMVDNRQKTNDLERMYMAEKKVRENELLIKNITLQKLTSDRWWIITSSVSILLIILVLYLFNYSKNKEKERKNEELLLQQQNALHEKEKELQKQKELELTYTIDKKNRELTTYTLYMVKNHEFIANLMNELKQLLLELNTKDRQSKDHIRQLLNKLSHQSSSDNWEEFSYYFEKVHPSFYRNLEKYFPDLTAKEKRLCAFLELGLSSKEISAITFKEVRSVESARNRLRKKLGINQEDNIKEFLHGYISS